MGDYSKRLARRLQKFDNRPKPKDEDVISLHDNNLRRSMGLNPIIKKKGLFLDDERQPREVTWVHYESEIEWTVVKTIDGFWKAIEEMKAKNQRFEAFSLDWYLGGGDTGMEVIKQLCDNLLENPPKEIPRVYMHSSDRDWRIAMDRIWWQCEAKLEEINEENDLGPDPVQPDPEPYVPPRSKFR